MQLITDLRTVRLERPTILTIGNFDGLHRGHQALLHIMAELAAQAAAQQPDMPAPAIGLLTFDPHPLAVLRPDKPIQLLTLPQERIQFAARAGADLGIIQPFTPEIAGLRAAEFMQLLRTHLNLQMLAVGPDFALGKGRSGNIERLGELGAELGYELHVIEPVDWNGKAARSSHIRQLLQTGEVAEAAELLSRPYHVTGRVIEGDHRGSTIGIPTANLQTAPNKMLPQDGVYATRTYVPLSPTHSLNVGDFPAAKATGMLAAYHSVTNIGMRPTVNGREHRFETHLLDFPPDGASGNLYDEILTVEFMARLRGEQKFAGIDELVGQIHRDIAMARQLFLVQE
ncbi:MAG: riboflavin biosynthesis protein RibF [Caldilineaceae bacterium]|nr:riboflavin biosynthesis protein RibF [Caldilineaceae bacterium]